MSVEKTDIEVFELTPFSKAYKRLSDKEQALVDDEIELIIENPDIGELKKGDLSHLRVHKFSMNKQQMLLGYHFDGGRLYLYLMQLGSHENFYSDAKKRRTADLKAIK